MPDQVEYVVVAVNRETGEPRRVPATGTVDRDNAAAVADAIAERNRDATFVVELSPRA